MVRLLIFMTPRKTENGDHKESNETKYLLGTISRKLLDFLLVDKTYDEEFNNIQPLGIYPNSFNWK